MTEPKLYIVHVGFYDREPNYGVYELHTNIFVAAESPDEAKRLAKASPWYRDKKMHTDGIQEIGAVMGYRVRLEPEAALNGTTQIRSFSYDDLNPAHPIGNS